MEKREFLWEKIIGKDITLVYKRLDIISVFLYMFGNMIWHSLVNGQPQSEVTAQFEDEVYGNKTEFVFKDFSSCRKDGALLYVTHSAKLHNRVHCWFMIYVYIFYIYTSYDRYDITEILLTVTLNITPPCTSHHTHFHCHLNYLFCC
jgi:predicted permease